MKFQSILTEAILLKRSFGFLAEVMLTNNQKRMLYCPNLGPLKNCDILGSRIWFSHAHYVSQGYLDVWEITEVDGGWLVLMNANYAGILVREAIESHRIPVLDQFYFLQNPILPHFGSGIEMLLKDNGEQCFVHIEPVLTVDSKNKAYCPETRGYGNAVLEELIALKEAGYRVVLLYCVQHNGATSFSPAKAIDPNYAKLLNVAVSKGVEVLAYRLYISLQEVVLGTVIPVLLETQTKNVK